MKIVSTIVLLSIGTSTAISDNEQPKDPGVRGAFQNFVKEASIDNCDAYCRGAYRYPRDQEVCKRVLGCSRGDFLQEDTASPETADQRIRLGSSAGCVWKRVCNSRYFGNPAEIQRCIDFYCN